MGKRRNLDYVGVCRCVGLASIALAGCGSAASYDLSNAEAQALYQQCVDGVPKPPPASAAPPVDFDLELAPTNPSEIDETLRRRDRAQMHLMVATMRYHAVVRARCESLRPRSSGGASGSGGGSAGSGGSSTNNQVAGVDEADFIKTDDGFLYVARGDRLRIIDVRLPNGAYEIASAAVPGEARRLFVNGNRVVVYSAVGAGGSTLPEWNRGRETSCTYAYSCSFSGDGTETVMSVFDISDRRTPALVRKLHSTGSFLAARRVEDMIHTVLVQRPLSTQAGWDTYPKSLPEDARGYTPGYWSWPPAETSLTPIPTEAEVVAAFDELLRENEDKIQSFSYVTHLPRVDDATYGPGLRRRDAATPHVLWKSRDPDGESFTTFLSLDLATDKPANATTIISKPGAVYASKQAIYMAVAHNRWGSGAWYGGRNDPQVSTVHQIAIGAAPLDTSYRASGLVPGSVLGQFAMDEADGRLRIATTTGRAPDPKTRSTLTVLERRDKTLLPVGTLDNIAPTEDIRSVRFDGTRAYVVTFKKTDPLFVFDLADPTAPRMLGELKIPGYSTYMHMMDDAHLLTIGYDAADKGDFAYFTGVLLQIFDVSNATAPTLLHRHVIGTRGSSSEALTNHLAFTYFAPKNMLALPMTICEGGDENGGYGTDLTFSGLMVFDVTVTNGFALHGKVSHPTSKTTTCANWWTDANSEVRRSIFKDDVVFSVSNKRIKVNALGALEASGRELELE